MSKTQPAAETDDDEQGKITLEATVGIEIPGDIDNPGDLHRRVFRELNDADVLFVEDLDVLPPNHGN